MRWCADELIQRSGVDALAILGSGCASTDESTPADAPSPLRVLFPAPRPSDAYPNLDHHLRPPADAPPLSTISGCVPLSPPPADALRPVGSRTQRGGTTPPRARRRSRRLRRIGSSPSQTRYSRYDRRTRRHASTSHYVPLRGWVG
jgi:hypothetical protein